MPCLVPAGPPRGSLEPKPAKAGDDTVAVVVGVVLDVVLFTEQTSD